MLNELSIKNFAIIEDLTINFKDGLTVFSGETGAGKSIIINAVNLLLGGRASSKMVRTGAEAAELEALFHIPVDGTTTAMLKEQGYEPAEDLVIRRIISRNDRHRVYINGRLATMQQLTELTQELAAIAGQHEHQRLLDEAQHLLILDQYANLMPLRAKVHDAFHELMPMIYALQHLVESETRQKEQIELLLFQKNEIEAAAITPAEDEKLRQEQIRLKNAETLHQTVWSALETLYSGEAAVAGKLKDTAKMIEKTGAIDPALLPSAAELSDITFRVEDMARHLQSYMDNISFDQARLDEIEARLDFLNRLKRKYGASLEAVIGRLAAIEKDLSDIENLSDRICQAEKQINARRQDLMDLSAELFLKRQKAAAGLVKEIEAALKFLKMPKTRVDVEFIKNSPAKSTSAYLVHEGALLSDAGTEQARFLISPNVGEELRPLSAIASGGELSRVILALKTIMSATDGATMIFDEVDAGIGGEVAEMVGKKLSDLSVRNQVICITHLAQIAKFARHHYKISKHVEQGRTRTRICNLNTEERLEETARMIGGAQITQATRDHAKELLDSGHAQLTLSLKQKPKFRSK